MLSRVECPSAEYLERLLLGQWPGPEAERLEKHLAECHRCANLLCTLHAEDALVESMRRARSAGEDKSENTILGPLIERLKELRLATTTSPDAATESMMTKTEMPVEPVGPKEPHRELLACLAPAQQPDELGRLGPYRVLTVLSWGGMGVVFRAEDPQLQRQVALKAMLPKLASNPDARSRFLREARLAASIKHDHIVTIHQVGEDRGVLFLAMELLEGEPLQKVLERLGKLPARQVIRIGREIAAGLAVAHGQNLIHRDIKPANIWVERRVRSNQGDGSANCEGDACNDDKLNAPGVSSGSSLGGRMKILDFGLAREADDNIELTPSGAIVGTPAYMVPEQVDGRDVDHRCDLFSLGCVLYRATTGQAAFSGDTTFAIYQAVTSFNPPAPHEVDPLIPQSLSNLIMRLLAKNPAQRPATAAALAMELAAIDSSRNESTSLGTDIQNPPQTRTGHKGKRRRLLVLAASALLLLLAGIGAVYVATGFKTRDGTLVVKVMDADAKVYVDGEEKTVVVDSQKTGRVQLEARPARRDNQTRQGGTGCPLDHLEERR